MRLPLGATWNLRQTVETEIRLREGGSIQFRIELFEADKSKETAKQYRFRVFRYDTFRILPFLYAAAGDSARFADHEFLVTDSTFDLTTVTANNPSEALDQLFERMRRSATSRAARCTSLS